MQCVGVKCADDKGVADITFSDEPGVYLPGRFGIRLEDCVVVTPEGADNFGTWQPSLHAPA